MVKHFSFHTLPGSTEATEANIFIHGYSAGHSPEDRAKLVSKIPETIKHYRNIFAFWPSGHYSRLNATSRSLVNTSRLVGGITAGALVLTVDRGAHFKRMRSRAEDMGELLPIKLAEYLRLYHPKINTINLVGHSLGGRLAVSCLKAFASTPPHRLSINDVLLMAAAVDVTPDEAKQMRDILKGRLINAYSKGDWTLLMNLDETCLGRNEVEHFENIEIGKFGHGDYWAKLPEVFKRTRFKSSEEIPPPWEDALADSAQAPQSAPSPNEPQQDEQIVTLDLNTPADIYLRVNEEIDKILGSLTEPSTDATLNKAQDEAYELLTEQQAVLKGQLTELEKNAEWNTFTIAFYGETGAGKSTIIETLRILLQEPGKLASQNKFRELQCQYGASEENVQQLQRVIEQANAQLTALEQQLTATLRHYEKLHTDALNTIDQTDALFREVTQQLSEIYQQHEQQHSDALNAIALLQERIAERKQTASIWKKLLNLFRKMPEEIELAVAKQQLTEVAATRDNAGLALRKKQLEVEQSKLANEQHLSEIETARDNATKTLLVQKAVAEENQRTLTQEQREGEDRLTQLLAELEQLADGEIIGDGRADFTRQTHRYDFELNGQPFALLDVPGIEGNEGLVDCQIVQAVQTAHAVFYVTNQAAPPQTGDDQRKGTLEKIKAHLGAQTEVWTIFNKKITNVKLALTSRPLTSEDEKASLIELDKKMREQLGRHYREVFPLTALVAFLASTDHFAPNSQNANRRNKMTNDFSPEELLEKSRLRAFLQLLGSQLLSGSKYKISRANLHKANEALGQAANTIEKINYSFSALSEKLNLEGQNAKILLIGSFSALKTRLEATGQRQVDYFASSVREEMYKRIDGEISNDDFKDALKNRIDAQLKSVGEQLPTAMAKDVERFQKDVEDILYRFEAHASELTAIYSKLGSAKLDGEFNMKLDLDNGVKVTNLLMLLTSGAVLFWNPAGWAIIALSVAGFVLGAYKAVQGFFSTDYRKAQQRKAVDDNLFSVTKRLHATLCDGLNSPLMEMRTRVDQIELALEVPAKQTTKVAQLLSRSISQMKALSRQINSAGSM